MYSLYGGGPVLALITSSSYTLRVEERREVALGERGGMGGGGKGGGGTGAGTKELRVD